MRFRVSAAAGVAVAVILTAPQIAVAAGSSTSQRVLVQHGSSQLIELVAGHTHECGILRTHTVECWGWNFNGQLGHGTTTSSTLPVAVKGLGGVRQLSLGFAQSCAVVTSGTVRCWGWNKYGQLGNGSKVDSPVPVVVRGLHGVRAVALGFAHSCALLIAGTVKCWGWNTYGQLGNGTLTSSTLPVAVRGLSKVRQIAAAYGHSCALLSAGTVACWGWNQTGQLGDGRGTSTRLPVPVRGLTRVIQITLGYEHSCALLQTHTVRCWGWNHYGQLGDGSTATTHVPVTVRGLSGVTQIGAAFGNTCALLASKTVKCWGWNGYGQLGTGTKRTSRVPVATRRLEGAIQVAVGDDSTCALLRQLVYSCWGWNFDGELGDGDHRTLEVPPFAPAAPTGVGVAFRDAAVLVSWTSPHSHGVGPVTRFTATSSQGHHSCTTSSTSCLVAGLVNGSLYRFTVTATNIVGAGPPSALSPPARPATVPAAPTSVIATRGNGSAHVSWTAPASDGGSAVTSFTATSTPGAHSCTTSLHGCTVSGLTNGASYTFKVTATNVAGTGPDSAASLAVTPAAVPDPPTGVSATRGNGSAMVTWTAPSNNGGSAITGYTATAADSTTPAHGHETCTWSTGPLNCTELGLTNGDSYTFTVTATSGAGTGLPSAASTSVTPATVPGAPTGVAAVPGAGSAAVTWSAPASNGGTAITGYTVTAADSTTPGNGGETCTWTAGPHSCTVSALTNGDSYTFTVKATNGVGTGSASTASSPVTPATTPGAPTGVSASAGDSSALVSWSAPASNGGSTITAYKVTAADSTTPGNGGETCTWTAGPHSCTVSALTNGDSYTFTVTATNGVGTGSASTASSPVTPATSPGAPTGVSATPGDSSALVSWSAPASNGGSTITAYTVTAADSTTPGNGGETCTWSAGPLSCTVSALTNGDSYTFTVTATNGVGTGSASTASSPVTPATSPGAPTGVSATPGNGSALVSWSAPASNGGRTITAYTVTAADSTTPANGGQTCTWSAGPLSCTVSALTNGDSYTFTVTATNGVGTGSASTASSPVMPATVPDAPTSVVALGTVGSATVSWSAPASDGGSTITAYTVTAVDSTTPANGGQTCTWTAGPLTCSVLALTAGDLYTFTVTATNGVGTGAASAPSNSVAPLIVVVGGNVRYLASSRWRAHLWSQGDALTVR